MKQFIVFSFFTVYCSISIGQTSSSSSNNRLLYFSVGSSFNGTGDQTGFLLLNGFSKDYNGWNLSGEIAVTLYNDFDYFFYTSPAQPGRLFDGSIRSNTHGVQLNFIGSRRIIRSNGHHFNAGLGPVVRYQSTSIPDFYEFLQPTITNLPIPVLYFDHRSKQNTYAIGGILKLLYSYDISAKINLGAHISVQTDSNGDTISNGAFQIGYRL